jgi:hypothetical protein
MTTNPRFILELSLTNTADRLKVDDTGIIDDELITATWNMAGLFIESILDKLNIEADETRFRELVIELCYRVILREMTTLRNFPVRQNLRTKSRNRRDRKRQGDTNDHNG